MTAERGARAAHITTDGFIRNAQLSPELMASERWDGRGCSYVPDPQLRIDRSLTLDAEADAELDPVTYQVLRSRFWNKNLEHGDVIQRVSGSAPVVYSRDYATAILTEDGEVVTISPTICFFSTLADLVVKWTLEHRSAQPGIGAGDVFLQNDPFIGAAQQADTSFYAPVFWEGRLFCWVFNTLHVGDLGGVDPGGWAINARDIFDESVVVPPMKIVEAGVTRWDLVDAFVRQSREPDSIRLNVKSALAGIAAIRAQMLEMLEEFGPSLIKGVMRRMIADCSRVVAARLRQIPDGSWSERMYVTGVLADPRQTHQEVLTLTKRGDQVICSNAGTSPQGGAGNSTYGFLRSSVVGALATALAWDQLGCAAGVANHVAFEPVAGTRSVARWPAAVSGHLSTFITLNVSALVTSKMVLAGPPELRSHAHALGGLSLPLGDVVFGLSEAGTLVGTPAGAGQALLGGCIGAFPGRDGIDSGGSWWLVGSSAGNVEESEETGVTLVLFRSENPDSGGPGRWRGGNSLAVGWVPGKVFMAAAQMTWADPSTNPVAGLAGGYYGLGGNFLRLGSDALGRLMSKGQLPASRDEIEALAGPMTRLGPKELVLPLPHGDCIVVEFNGSGGFGDPLAREPQAVAADVLDGAVSAQAAERHYGVLLGPDGEPDAAATERRRAEIRAARLAGASAFDGAVAAAGEPGVVVLAGAAGSVDLARRGDELVWACAQCAAPLGPASSNYKLAARYRDHFPPALDARLYADPAEFGDAEIVLRHYWCSSCAALLAQELCRRGDDPWHDVRLDLDALAADA